MPFPMLPSINWYTEKAIMSPAMINFKFLLNIF